MRQKKNRRNFAQGGGIASQYYVQGGGIVSETPVMYGMQTFTTGGQPSLPGAVDSDLYGGLQSGLFASQAKVKGALEDLPRPRKRKAAAVDGASGFDLDAYMRANQAAETKKVKEQDNLSSLNTFAPGGEIPQNAGDQVPPGYYPASGGPQGAGGHLLDGPGDGMSDSIPAMITGEEPQRAALADGEFVISADVVSHIGNGSTKAGAAKLYALMDQIRQARTGTTEQAPEVNPDPFLNRLV